MIKNNIIKNTDHLQAEIRDGIGIIAFNRPEAKNALSDELTPELRRTLVDFESNREVRVVIITGNGGAPPFPVIITTLTSRLLSKSTKVRLNSGVSSSDKAFFASGLLNAIIPIPSLISA